MVDRVFDGWRLGKSYYPFDSPATILLDESCKNPACRSMEGLRVEDHRAMEYSKHLRPVLLNSAPSSSDVSPK